MNDKAIINCLYMGGGLFFLARGHIEYPVEPIAKCQMPRHGRAFLRKAYQALNTLAKIINQNTK